MSNRNQAQVAEAKSELNRWYCSQAHGREIQNEELLLRHYIQNGGAKSFADRYAEAMSETNRYYCSKCYGRDVWESEILWDYYLAHAVPSMHDNRPGKSN